MGLDQLVALVNRLQSACSLLGDNATSGGDGSLPSLWNALPQVVVIGGQSSGKSSVLESVVGRDFLPRGSGIVTRRPLVLQLIKTDGGNDRAEFLHLKGEVFQDFDAVREEIEDETRRSLGPSKAVSPEPIQLTVHSKNVPTLTLVDMPGLTKIPIEGQPKSIVQDIDNMVMDFVKGDNVIILAVSPANADIATSDAIRMARTVDPDGDRTIGVLTKLDIMDRGTNALDILEGRSCVLKHGWVGVVNRSQADINGKVDMKKARAQEEKFFKDSEYAHLKNVGTTNLSNKVVNHLEQAILRQLPQIQSYLNDSVIDLHRELEDLGVHIPSDRGAMLHMVLELCRTFEREFADLLDGGRGGGESILEAFEQKLVQNIRNLPFKELYSLKNVAQIINEADGYQPHLIAPEMGYRRLIESGLGLLKGPSERCVEEVHGILRGLVESAIHECKELARYPTLRAEMQRVAYDSLEAKKEETRRMVTIMVEMESSYLTAEFFRRVVSAQMAGSNAGPEALNIRTLNGVPVSAATEGVPPEELHLRRITAHVSAYVAAVCDQLKTTVPKAVVHSLVLSSKKELLKSWNMQVAGMGLESLQRLLSEDEAVMKRRTDCSNRLELLQQAAGEIAAATAQMGLQYGR